MTKNKTVIAIVLISIAVIALFASVVYAMGLTKFIGVDWWKHFMPATASLVSGGDPYQVTGFYSPPWLLAFLLPFAYLPIEVSTPIIFILNTIGFTWFAYKAGVNKYAILPLFVFSGALMNAVKGNLDGILLFSFYVPPWLGILILMTKPQIGIPVILCYFLSIVTTGGRGMDKARYILKISMPFIIINILSLALFGDWYSHAGSVIGRPWNTSILWPFGVPAGLFLIWHGVKNRNINYALLSIPFMSPYIASTTWALVFLGAASLLSRPWRIGLTDIQFRELMKRYVADIMKQTRN